MSEKCTIPRICIQCGSPFLAYKSRVVKGQGKFCSHPCYLRFRNPSPEIRFWRNVEKSDGCWLWLASKDEKGYGYFSDERGTIKAHRFAYELAHGTIPDGLMVCHSCDNPPCVRADHLFLGPHIVNIRDRDTKGRQARGETNAGAKLSAAQVLDIRARYAAGGITLQQLADEHGVFLLSISNITRRVTWKHI